MNSILLLIEDSIPYEYIRSYTVREYVYREGDMSDSMIQVAGSYVIPSRHGFLLRESWCLPNRSHKSRFIIAIETSEREKVDAIAEKIRGMERVEKVIVM